MGRDFRSQVWSNTSEREERKVWVVRPSNHRTVLRNFQPGQRKMSWVLGNRSTLAIPAFVGAAREARPQRSHGSTARTSSQALLQAVGSLEALSCASPWPPPLKSACNKSLRMMSSVSQHIPQRWINSVHDPPIHLSLTLATCYNIHHVFKSWKEPCVCLSFGKESNSLLGIKRSSVAE